MWAILWVLALLKVKDAIRKRTRGKQPDPENEDMIPKPKGKGRGKGSRKPKVVAEPAPAASATQPEPKNQDVPSADGQNAADENRSPNKRPAKSRKQAKEPEDKEALKKAWSQKDRH